MRRRVRAGRIAVGVLAVATLFPREGVRAQARPYVFSSFDFPGAAVTQAYGINARGDIVGTYQKPAPGNSNHGFLLEGGRFTTIDFPGGNTSYSLATAISPAGDIAGYYGVIGGAATSAFGFLRDKHGRWTTLPDPIEPPPTMTPSPFRILPDGTMLGCFHYATPGGAYISMHGFTLTPDGNVTRFDYPTAAPMAMHYGATPDGRTIVGVYTQAGVNHGYLLDDGVLSTFDVPGSARTTPQDINAAGVIVGTYRNPGESSTTLHSFVLDTHRSTDETKWEYALLVDVPGASITRIRGINSGGDLVGDYIGADGKNHAFVASRTGL